MTFLFQFSLLTHVLVIATSFAFLVLGLRLRNLCLSKKNQRIGTILAIVSAVIIIIPLLFITFYISLTLWWGGDFSTIQLIPAISSIFLGIGIYLLKKKKRTGVILNIIIGCIVVASCILLPSLYMLYIALSLSSITH